MFFSQTKGQNDLTNKQSPQQLLKAQNFFKKHLLSTSKLSFPEVKTTEMSFEINRTSLDLSIEIRLTKEGFLSGKCFRDLHKKKNSDFLGKFYEFYVSSEKELKKEISILNLLLKTF